jgi:hypothetical protein
MKQIDSTKALKLIKSTKGKVFTAVFTKKDGTIRKMNCRLGVSKAIVGTGLAYNPADHNLLTVFDMKEKGYRMLNIETLTALQVSKKFYIVVG